MRRLVIIVGILVVALGAAVVATQFLRPAPTPPPIIPSASPTPSAITTVDDLYRAEAALGNLDVDGADDAYQQALEKVR